MLKNMLICSKIFLNIFILWGYFMDIKVCLDGDLNSKRNTLSIRNKIGFAVRPFVNVKDYNTYELPISNYEAIRRSEGLYNGSTKIFDGDYCYSIGID